jgi:hypothetical protein
MNKIKTKIKKENVDYQKWIEVDPEMYKEYKVWWVSHGSQGKLEDQVLRKWKELGR